MAKFVQGCSGHTSYIRAASIDVDTDIDGSGVQQCLGLTLIDTPSLDFKDESSSERLIIETMRHIDSRFADGVEDVSACLFDGNLIAEFNNRIGGTKAAIAMFTCAWRLALMSAICNS